MSPKWANQIADKEEARSEVALSLKERIERAKQEMESEERRKHCAAQEVAHNRVDCTTQEVSPKEKKAPSRRRSSDSGKDLPSPKKKKIGPTLPPPTVAAKEEQGQEDTRDMVSVGTKYVLVSMFELAPFNTINFGTVWDRSKCPH